MSQLFDVKCMLFIPIEQSEGNSNSKFLLSQITINALLFKLRQFQEHRFPVWFKEKLFSKQNIFNYMVTPPQIKIHTLCACFSSTNAKVGMTHRRLAWSLHKDDTQIHEVFHIYVYKSYVALNGLAQLVGCHPTKQKVAGSIPGPGTCLDCRLGPSKPTNVSLPLICFSLPFPLSKNK